MIKHNWHKLLIAVLLMFPPLDVEAETILNQNRTQNQEYVSAARLSNGRFVAGWYSNASGFKEHWFNIFDSQFDRRFFWESDVSSATELSRGMIRFASSTDGFYVAAFARWTSDVDTTNIDIFLNKFNDGGGMLEEDVHVNNDTLGNQWIVSVIIDEQDEKIVVVWGTNPQGNPDQRHYYLRQLDFDLNYNTDDIPLYVGDDESFVMSDVKGLSPSRLIAVSNYGYDWAEGTIAVLTFDYDGSNRSALEDLSTLSEYCYHGSIAEVQGDGALVVWSAFDAIYEVGIWGRRIDVYGDPIDTVEVLLSVPDDEYDGEYEIQNAPVAAFDDAGCNLALCWSQQRGFNQSFDLACRFLNHDLQALTDTFTVSQTGSNAFDPAVVYLASDSFVVVWDSYVDSNRRRDIFGTVIRPPETQIPGEGPVYCQPSSLAYPNPFNRQTNINYSIPEAVEVDVSVFSVTGQKIANLVHGYLPAGDAQVMWDASNVASGVYFYRIQASDVAQTGKMILLK